MRTSIIALAFCLIIGLTGVGSASADLLAEYSSVASWSFDDSTDTLEAKVKLSETFLDMDLLSELMAEPAAVVDFRFTFDFMIEPIILEGSLSPAEVMGGGPFGVTGGYVGNVFDVVVEPYAFQPGAGKYAAEFAATDSVLVDLFASMSQSGTVAGTAVLETTPSIDGDGPGVSTPLPLAAVLLGSGLLTVVGVRKRR